MSYFLSLDDRNERIDNYQEYCNRYGLNEVNICPICHKAISADMHDSIESSDNNILSVILECPACKEIFMVNYEYYENDTESMGYKIKEMCPQKPIEKQFEEEIINLSPNFVETYNQSLIAENYKLDQIAGMGYRKSIEYLIKDYIIYNNPKDEEKVKSTFLGTCIKDMINNPKIQKMAKGATWLGNDATHYVQKWNDKDITDLKKLIDLTVYWIMYEFKTKEYEEMMKL